MREHRCVAKEVINPPLPHGFIRFVVLRASFAGAGAVRAEPQLGTYSNDSNHSDQEHDEYQSIRVNRVSELMPMILLRGRCRGAQAGQRATASTHNEHHASAAVAANNGERRPPRRSSRTTESEQRQHRQQNRLVSTYLRGFRTPWARR